MTQTGLAVEQAPPMWVPFRFFFTAPVFGVLAAAMLAWGGADTLEALTTPATLAATHFLTLGFMAMVMFGAIMQIMPVLAGSPIPAPRLTAWCVHLPLTGGSLALSLGFVVGGTPLLRIGVVLLAVAFGAFILAVAAGLLRAPARGATRSGMWLALCGLAATATSGILLASSRSWDIALPGFALQSLHPAWGLIGWTALLVTVIACIVVPMFQMTRPYPPLMTRWLHAAIACLLVVWSALAWNASAAEGLMQNLPGFAIAACCVLFAAVTLRLQANRRRRLPDVTLDFWRVAMVSIAAAAVLWTLRMLAPQALRARVDIVVGILMIQGFAMSAITGMLCKIVPFMVWFHLQALNLGRGVAPNMKMIIPDKKARRQFRLHLAALAAMLAAVAVPEALVPVPEALVQLAALLLAMAQGTLLWNLVGASRLFRRYLLIPRG
jgi:hypothetical protein